ncbi:uncharacterized protein Smp_202860 [Schistosoma mansoni]|uniref:uncharacterized protein n=1 Tax=Schistosoma mansoni TaxID=6183 RepID=UPI00022DC10C|nr:uncharacterized protein Smp_202860 [Schistosoma mansoni]|eukprot:XP_018652805.1 uncharacterized protein Smp_202860 [Schistosoma mansoni]
MQLDVKLLIEARAIHATNGQRQLRWRKVGRDSTVAFVFHIPLNFKLSAIPFFSSLDHIYSL